MGGAPGEGKVVMQEAHSRLTIVPLEPWRSVQARTSTWETITGTLILTKEKGGGVVSRPPSPCPGPMRLDSSILIIMHCAAKTGSE